MLRIITPIFHELSGSIPRKGINRQSDNFVLGETDLYVCSIMFGILSCLKYFYIVL